MDYLILLLSCLTSFSRSSDGRQFYWQYVLAFFQVGCVFFYETLWERLRESM